ncbi:MAG: hypothetical protein H0W89_03705 [Candidatus Levybacteria bacterium]|nr:hypothetical protein [Candidatus Levybacteria bacterium]
MKKILATLIAGGTYLTLASTSFATSVDPCGEIQSGFDALCNLSGDNLGEIVGAAVTFLLVIAVLIALFFLIFGGIRWITSGGDKAKVESARGTIIAAIIGLVIAFLAFFILSVALQFFGLELSNLEVIK